MPKIPRTTAIPYRFITIVVLLIPLFSVSSLWMVVRARTERPGYGCLQYSQNGNARNFVDIATGQPVSDGAIAGYVDPIHFEQVGMSVEVKPSNTGRYLTYMGNNGTYGELYVRKADVPAFTAPRTTLLHRSQGLNFAWSPDDSRIAFVYNDSQNNFGARLAISDWDGTDRIDVSLEGSQRGDYIELNGFSPDGSVLALAYRNLELMRKVEFYDAATLRKISELPYARRSSTQSIPLELVIWSPTETRFATVEIGDTGAWVTVGTPTEPEQHIVRFGENRFMGGVVWSPDGEALIAWYPEYDRERNVETTEFMLLRRDGTQEFIGQGSLLQAGIESVYPSKSAWFNGEWVFTRYASTANELELAVYNPVSGETKIISRSAIDMFEPVGKYLYFTAYEADRSISVNRLNVDGAVDSPAELQEPDFAFYSAARWDKAVVFWIQAKDGRMKMYIDRGNGSFEQYTSLSSTIVTGLAHPRLYKSKELIFVANHSQTNKLYLRDVETGRSDLLIEDVQDELQSIVSHQFSSNDQFLQILTYTGFGQPKQVVFALKPNVEEVLTVLAPGNVVWSPDSTQILLFNDLTLRVFNVQNGSELSITVDALDSYDMPKWVWCR
jgi:WD40 repeat protein